MIPERPFRPTFEPMAPPIWSGQPCIVVGTGPSLKGFDFASLRGLGRIVAVKESMFDLPFADVIHGVDLPWMGARNAELARRAAEGCEVILSLPDQPCMPHTEVAGAKYAVRLRTQNRMTDRIDALECGAHSGFSALNIAWHRWPCCVVLFGYDYGPGHYNEPRYSERGGAGLWQHYASRWALNFKDVAGQFEARKIPVLNASPGSALPAFKKVGHGEALDYLHRMGPARD